MTDEKKKKDKKEVPEKVKPIDEPTVKTTGEDDDNPGPEGPDIK